MEEQEEVGGRLEDEDDGGEDFEERENEEDIEEKINDDQSIPDSNEGAGLSEEQKSPSDDEIIQGEIIKTLEEETVEDIDLLCPESGRKIECFDTDTLK